MCMITYVPANIDIPWEGIENGATFNDDGHGWAIASKTYGLEVGKSMDYDIAALTLAVAREKHGPDSLVLFHSRFATHGKKTEFNVHPFYVDAECPSVYDEVDEKDELRQAPLDTVMAHNGILPARWQPTKSDIRSDTRIFADRVGRLYTHNGVPSRRGGKSIGNMIGSGNKLVFLTAKDGQPKVRIVNAHLGIFTDGVWYSNDGYRPTYWRGGYTSGYFTSRRWDDYDYTSGKLEETDGADLPGGQRVVVGLPSGKDACPWCKQVDTIDAASDTCSACEVCLSCNEWMGDCDCYLSDGEREAKEVREAAQTKGKDVELWTPTGSPLNPTFKPAEVGIEV